MNRNCHAHQGFLYPMMRSIAAAAFGLLLASSSAVAQEPSVIANEARATPLAAYGGWFLWSHYDEDARRYRLVGMEGSDGPTTLPVRSRSVPFDVDIGPGANGRPVAVYSRCRREVRSGLVSPVDSPPPYRLGRGCAMYELDLDSQRERLVLRRSGHSLTQPAVWRNTLAFVVQGRSGSDVHVETATRRGRRTEFRRVPAGRKPAPGDHTAGPIELDLTRGAIVIGWRNLGDRRCPESPEVRADSELSQILLWTAATRRTREVDRGCNFVPTRADGHIFVGFPAFGQRTVHWIRLLDRQRGSYLITHPISGARRSRLFVDPFAVWSAAAGPGTALVQRAGGDIVAFPPSGEGPQA